MLLTLLAFLGLLLVLVLVHEWGHFTVARWFGITVEEFGFGFPPRMFKFIRHGVTYSINWLPLGGFVRLKGEGGELRSEPDSFVAQTPGKRVLVLLAGVAMNVVLAYVLLTAMLVVGQPTIMDDASGKNIQNVKIHVVEVDSASPAAKAGIVNGSEIVAVDGQAVADIAALQSYVNSHSGVPINVTILFDKSERVVQLVPQVLAGSEGRAVMGVSLVQVGIIKFPWYEALWRGAAITIGLAWEILKAFGQTFANLIVQHQVPSDVAGPVGIAVLTGQVVELGWAYVLQFAALLSLNLAIINVLPFPALDGGRVLFVVIEKIRGKVHSAKLEQLIHTIGFALLMLLAIAVTYHDVVRLGGNFLSELF